MSKDNTVLSEDEFGTFGLPVAPTFYPTEEEFKDPWSYLNSIRAQLHSCGIGIIQPPDSGWDFNSFEKRVNYSTFVFDTKAQNVHQMLCRDGSNTTFFRKLQNFWDKRGQQLSSYPEIVGSPVDLYQLHSKIENRGGFDKVDKDKIWAQLATELRLVSATDSKNRCSSVSHHLRNTYIDYVLPLLQEGGLSPTKKSPNKRSHSSTDDESGLAPGRKKRKLDNEAVWKQVHSRSFAKDANDQKKKNSPLAIETDCIVNIPVGVTDETDKSRSMSMKRGRKASFPRKGKTRMGSLVSSDSDTEEGIKDFGYDQGRTYNLKQYKEAAEEMEKRWGECKTPKEKEKMYWKIIENGDQFVKVFYGSDLDVAMHASGFPTSDENQVNHAHYTRRAKLIANLSQQAFSSNWDVMAKHSWNTNNLAKSTFLRHINESVGGLTRPMIYVGMLFSSFCWHTEDNYLYSVNYLHTGKPKLWYGVPGDAAVQFEETFKSFHPELFKKNPNLLHLLVTQLSPKVLKEKSVPCYTALQKPGQFIVTCPRAYHAGFNTGFNVAESVNFALEDWLPLCRQACDDYRFKRAAVFPFEEFLLKAALNTDSPLVCRLLQSELLAMVQREQQQQSKVFNIGVTQYVVGKSTQCQSCDVCGYDCFLSGIFCKQHPEMMACLSHAQELCDCSSEFKCLLIRVSAPDIIQVMEMLHKKTIIEV